MGIVLQRQTAEGRELRKCWRPNENTVTLGSSLEVQKQSLWLSEIQEISITVY